MAWRLQRKSRRTFIAYRSLRNQAICQFNHFLVKDDEPLLFHTGLRGMHAEIREAVSKLIQLSELRHISFSHFESDECGSLNEWLAAAPKADVICSEVGARVNVNDFIGRESRSLADGGTFGTGNYRFRYCRTPHLPHGWDAGVLFEETRKRCSARTCFIRTATWNRSAPRISWAARIRR